MFSIRRVSIALASLAISAHAWGQSAAQAIGGPVTAQVQPQPLTATPLFKGPFTASLSPQFARPADDGTSPPGQTLPPAFSCAPGSTSCANGDGTAIYGGSDASSNIFQDLNPAGSGRVSGSNLIYGANNTLSASNADNMISGWGNTAAGKLGNLTITGEANNVHSDDSNISITGSGNTVTGTQGENWGLNINGGSNQVDSSSGTIDGSVNTVSNVTRGTIDGFLNNVTNASDTAILGNGNTVTNDQTITVGNGNTNTASQGVVVGNHDTNQVAGGVILGNNSGLGADAINSVIVGNDTYTDRANTVDVGGRTISGVAPGVLPDDAANIGQLQQTLQQANDYTTQKFNVLNSKINQAGAASSALGLVAASAAGNPSGNRFAMGYANFNGQSGTAIAYQHIFNTRHPINFTLGVAFAGSQRTVGGAVSVGF